MKIWCKKVVSKSPLLNEGGQSLLETAVAMPLLLGIAFNLINVGYFWFMVLALAAAPRQGAQYSTQGGQAITSSSPSATQVSDLVYDNMTNAVHGARVNKRSIAPAIQIPGV